MSKTVKELKKVDKIILAFEECIECGCIVHVNSDIIVKGKTHTELCGEIKISNPMFLTRPKKGDKI